jgi:Ca-activated chloride channel family protein
MTMSVTPITAGELQRLRSVPDAGVGVLRTDRGNLPLDRLDVRASITGLVCRTVVTTEFLNAHDVALEATYVFPLPDRAAVTGMTMTADGRVVEAKLQERGAAREAYDQAIAAGRRASVAEEERPDVFTMRVGNILPGERVSVELRLVGALPYEDGAATYRFPLVVAPRYIPGDLLPGQPVGDGSALDTDAVPDASRITPPVLLPGFPNPLRLSIGVDIDPGGLRLGEVRSSLHTLAGEGGRLTIHPGERADRDFILRLAYAGATQAAVGVPDGEGGEGTYQLVVLPEDTGVPPRPKDVVLLLDRSGSMGGWKMVAARRAAARVVDTLTVADRFAVVTFDDRVDRPTDLDAGLVEATDRHRFRAVEHLSRADARGGTEMLAPLRDGLRLLADSGDRDRVLVLVTDGQIGNEDQILAELAPLVGEIRIHTVGIDRAVNAGFLGRLAALGAGRCELVESEDRLDEAMEHIHRRIGAPVVTDLAVTAHGLSVLDDTRTPRRLPGVYPGAPLVVLGRFTGPPGGTLTVAGRTRDDRPFAVAVPVQPSNERAITAQWARARLRDLEDRYAAGEQALEPEIVATSLRHGVLCRFTAYVAVDTRVVTDGTGPRRVTQPVELPSGWDMPMHGPMPASLGLAVAASAEMSMRAPLAPAGRPPAFAPVLAAMSKSAVPPGAIGPVRTRQHRVAADGGHARPTPGLREIIALEARRLRDNEGRSAVERRDLLADLASRLTVLLGGVTGNEYASLRTLLAFLAGDADLETKWREARRVFDAFPAAPPSPQLERRRSFWRA